MTDLIERLQAAEGPCRELDAEIDVLHREKSHPLTPANKEEWAGHVVRHGRFVAAPSYTSSIDAALTLFDCEDWEWALDNDLGGDCAPYRFKMGNPIRGLEGEAQTPALAICIAALKARGDQS